MWIWRQRLRAHHRLRSGEVMIAYHPSYSMSGLHGHSLSRNALERGERVLATLGGRGLVRPGDVVSAPRVELLDLARVHTMPYLESLNDPAVLGRIFGIDADHMLIDMPLAAQRHAVGGTLVAAKCVTRGTSRVALNLGGGLHHAHRERGSGFCAYNDVAVAIAALRAKGYDAPITIVDLDFHQGDGNEAIFAHDRSVLTYSLHGSTWQECDAVANVSVELPPGTRDSAYLTTLRETLPAALATHQPKLVFFIAGNDVLADDGLGDFALSPRGVAERDALVLEEARSLGAGVVIVLGGGYGNLAWRSTANLLRYVLTDYFNPKTDYPDQTRRHYDRIARELVPAELQAEPGALEFTEADIIGGLVAPAQTAILGYYTIHGIELALERYGFLSLLRQRGFGKLRVDGDSSDPQRQTLRIYGRKSAFRGAGEMLLVELVAGRRHLDAPAPLGRIEVLYVEWLLLQDPTRGFDLDRPQLPGQEHPGLGLATEMLELLRQVCLRLGLDGIASRPSNYHNALVASRECRHLDPEAEGRFRAIRRSLARHSLLEATHAIDRGRLRCADGSAQPWVPDLQVAPVSEAARAHFASDEYERAVRAAYERWRARGLHLVGETNRAQASSRND